MTPDCKNRNWPDRTRELNPNWKGGQTKHTLGYRRVIMDDGRYIFEHRKIMEEHLGRKLLDTETVHHINGVKDDNRIENLEVWVTVHPRGQRVKDLVDYAREILARYESEVLT